MKQQKFFLIIVLSLILSAITLKVTLIMTGKDKSLDSSIECLTVPFLFLKNSILCVEALPNSAKQGRDGWLFLGDDYEKVFSKNTGLIDADSALIDEAVKILANFSKEVGKENSRLFITIPYDKHHFYSEYLPIQPILKKRFSEEVQKKLITDFGISVIDVCAPIMKYKSHGNLYFKTDSHWNDTGAFYATKVLVNEIARQLNDSTINLSIDNFTFEDGEIVGDINKMVNIHTPERVKKSHLKDTLFRAPNNKKVLFIGDSYSNYMLKYLETSFGEVKQILIDTFKMDQIREFKPDLVIVERVERCAQILDMLK